MTGSATSSSVDPGTAAAFAHLRADARTTLAAWRAPDAQQDLLRVSYLEHLRLHA